jgi:glycosyltransferase involved in cell wall biosynthesis
MNEHTPLITVAMPIYNAGKDLRPAVLSIINQSFKDWELILIDDGSTDNSVSLIADLKDSRIKILQQDLTKLSTLQKADTLRAWIRTIFLIRTAF